MNVPRLPRLDLKPLQHQIVEQTRFAHVDPR
jgi:hypothetical protein